MHYFAELHRLCLPARLAGDFNSVCVCVCVCVCSLFVQSRPVLSFPNVLHIAGNLSTMPTVNKQELSIQPPPSPVSPAPVPPRTSNVTSSHGFIGGTNRSA